MWPVRKKCPSVFVSMGIVHQLEAGLFRLVIFAVAIVSCSFCLDQCLLGP